MSDIANRHRSELVQIISFDCYLIWWFLFLRQTRPFKLSMVINHYLYTGITQVVRLLKYTTRDGSIMWQQTLSHVSFFDLRFSRSVPSRWLNLSSQYKMGEIYALEDHYSCTSLMRDFSSCMGNSLRESSSCTMYCTKLASRRKDFSSYMLRQTGVLLTIFTHRCNMWSLQKERKKGIL